MGHGHSRPEEAGVASTSGRKAPPLPSSDGPARIRPTSTKAPPPPPPSQSSQSQDLPQPSRPLPQPSAAEQARPKTQSQSSVNSIESGGAEELSDGRERSLSASNSTPGQKGGRSWEERRQSYREARSAQNAELAHRMSTKNRKGVANQLQLTPAQISLIRGMWNQLKTSKGPTTLGTAVWQRLCFKAPLLRDTMARLPQPAIPQRFGDAERLGREHGKHVFRLLDETMKSLESLEKAVPFLNDVGKRHAPYAAHGFNPKLWSTFAEAFIDMTLEWGDKTQRKEDTRVAWALIINFIVDKLKQGYTQQRRRSSVRTVEGVGLGRHGSNSSGSQQAPLSTLSLQPPPSSGGVSPQASPTPSPLSHSPNSTSA